MSPNVSQARDGVGNPVQQYTCVARAYACEHLCVHALTVGGDVRLCVRFPSYSECSRSASLRNTISLTSNHLQRKPALASPK